MSITRRIFAMGGGGFCMEPENPLLDAYVLALTKKAAPRIALVPTASGDSPRFTAEFPDHFQRLGAVPSVVSLFRGADPNFIEHLLSQDIIYVSGGNTRNMLTLWKLWGVDEAIRAAYQNGVVLAGVSAGSICWFESGLTDSWPGELRELSCMGLLKGSNCPHYDGEPGRRPTYQRLVASGRMPDGIAADDGAGILYENESVSEVVSSRLDARAYRVERDAESVRETEIRPRYLG